MLDLTRQERAIFIFLLAFFALGTGVSIFRNYFSSRSYLTREQIAKQEGFLASFQNKARLLEANDPTVTENLKPSARDESDSFSNHDHLDRASAIPAQKINLNDASYEDLIKLPRVGPVMARRIIEWRQSMGRFEKPEDLKQVKGIGQKTFEMILPYIIVE